MQERVKRKTSVTVELDTALVVAANARGVDLAGLFEQALEARLRTGSQQPLSEEERASLDSYNRFIAEHGTLADAFRKL